MKIPNDIESMDPTWPFPTGPAKPAPPKPKPDPEPMDAAAVAALYGYALCGRLLSAAVQVAEIEIGTQRIRRELLELRSLLA